MFVNVSRSRDSRLSEGTETFFTARKRSCWKVMFLHLSVVLLPLSPGVDTLPPDTSTHGQQVGGMHPTGMNSCFIKTFETSGIIVLF